MKLNTLFQNGAVFQRNTHIPVWGRGEALHRIKACFGGKESFTMVNASGEFRLYLPPFDAGGPYSLTVSDLDSGESITFSDILVGDVWIASGQSNMQYLLESNWSQAPLPYEAQTNCKQFMEYRDTITDSSRFRFIMIQQCASGCRESDATGTWMPMDKEHAGLCTAVGAWFGRYVQEAVNVPIGIIGTYWGGTIAEAWTSEEALLTNPDTADSVMQVRMRLETEQVWTQNKQNLLTEITQHDTGNEGEGWGWASPDFTDYQWATMHIPGSWIKQNIAGNGAVWVRKKVLIPKEWEGRNLVLVTGGIDKHDISYFNGVEIGRSGKDFEEDVWNVPRHYPIPGKLVKAGENVIAIRAFSYLYEGCFWGENEGYYLQLEGNDSARVNISGKWYAKAEYDWGNLNLKIKTLGLGPGNPNTPGILFNGMVNPLLPYAIRGVIWYQGESNATSHEGSRTYLNKLKTMIADWRFRWGMGDFPFIQVQLANYMSPGNYNERSDWALLREAQRVICGQMKNVYMIPAIDIGEQNDIHPQDKKSVGRRMADCALANEYCIKAPSSPTFRCIRQEQHRLRVFFDNAEGLRLAGAGASCFCLFNANGESFIADEAVVEGSTVLLSAADCDIPVAVRYAWADNPDTALFNSDNLPAVPFSSKVEFR